MKFPAFILLLLVVFFIGQPLFSSRQVVAGMKGCSKMMKCHKQKPQSNKGCDNRSCNPFMACAYGNFYFFERNVFTFTALAVNSIKRIPANDDRLADTQSDCWHPPRTLPVFQIS